MLSLSFSTEQKQFNWIATSCGGLISSYNLNAMTVHSASNKRKLLKAPAVSARYSFVFFFFFFKKKLILLGLQYLSDPPCPSHSPIYDHHLLFLTLSSSSHPISLVWSQGFLKISKGYGYGIYLAYFLITLLLSPMWMTWVAP